MAEKNAVSAKHPSYLAYKSRRQDFVDVMKGTKHLRQKGQEYLQKFEAESPKSYATRLANSFLHNLTKETVGILTGLVFKGPIGISDPSPRAEDWAENIDNCGTSLSNFAREAFNAAYDGFSLIMTDSGFRPEGAFSLEDERRLGLRPYLTLYRPDDVINWRTRTNPISRSRETTLLVLRESENVATDRFLTKTEIRYRVLFLDSLGAVGWELYREQKADGAEDQYILIGRGQMQNQTEIPFSVIYGNKLGKGLFDTAPPLSDLAFENVRHYNKMSNYDNIINLAGLPIPYAKAMQSSDKKQIAIGVDRLIQLSKDGEFGWATVDSTGFDHLLAGLKDSEKKMGTLGLKMLSPEAEAVEQTATEVVLKKIDETAPIRVMSDSLRDALVRSYGFMKIFAGENTERTVVEINAAWDASSDDSLVGLDDKQTIKDLDRRLDLVNKGSEHLTQEEIRKILFPYQSDEERLASLEKIATENPVLRSFLDGGNE